jgi:hypothetical protein
VEEEVASHGVLVGLMLEKVEEGRILAWLFDLEFAHERERAR